MREKRRDSNSPREGGRQKERCRDIAMERR